MKDKEIDELLREIENSEFKVTLFDKKLDKENPDIIETVKVLNKSFNIGYLVDELKLIKYLETILEADLYGLTKKGRKVLRLGGWLKYLERQDEIEKRKERKENAELRISEFQARNQHLPYIVSFCGVFISIISLFITCNNSNDEPSQKKEHIKEYIEKEKTYQTKKNLDSDTLLIEKKKNE